MIPIPEELLEQLERGNVLLFIGERIVHDAEGRAVVDRLAAQLAARSGLLADEDASFPEAAQAYQDEKGRQALVQFLRDELEALGDEPQRVHHLIAGLTDCDLLVTTCLDRRLERAFEAAGRPLDVIVSRLDVAFEEEHKAQLYKLRGSLEQVESLVLTEDDYETFFEDQDSLSVVLQSYLARKTILFVGYDLADPHFKRLYRKVTAPLDHYARRAYAFGEAPSPLVVRWCERHGIDLVEADATAFLESLARQLAARARRSPAVARPVAVELATPLPERPYKFLDYYEARDASIFFGRQGEIQKLSSLIHAHRLVLLYGASGTGKTSLLLAGVAPRLEQAEPPYETLYVRALEDPAQVIRRALRRRLPEASLPLDAPLPDLLDAAARALGRTLVLILDQFEEFFIRLSPEFRAAFIAELGALYDARDVPVKVVLSLREDWLAEVNEIRARIPEVFYVDMRLLPLSRAQAEEAITAPVVRLGASYEPALVERLLDDLGDTEAAVMPPQLQLVCSALYDGLGPDERRITLTAYQDDLKGAQGVLQKYLKDELGRLGRDEAALARAALQELVTSQGTKAVKTSDELALALGANRSELEAVLEKLVRARLLRVLEREEGGTAYELAHECLIAEIVLSPEAVARKEAEELLRQGMENRQRFGALLPAETFAVIDAQRDRLRFDPEAQELMLRSALRLGRSVGEWLGRVEHDDQALALAEEALLAPEGEPARQGLGAGAGEVPPGRLQALVGRLAGRWRGARGTERIGASDALWALRRHLPGGLRLRLALGRSPRLMRRVAPLLAGVVVAALVFVAILWGPRLWTPKPEIEWLEIPAGEFLMGSDPAVDPDAYLDEMPQHQVYLDGYQIGRYEVTNAQYAQCVRATVCWEPSGLSYYPDPAYTYHPVVYVSWFDARTFCEWVGGRLPTEAEWEYAARGTDGRIYPWGNEPPDESRCNFDYSVIGTTPVGRYSPPGDGPPFDNDYGCADMAGNVWEWVADWYDGGYYSVPPERNPQGPDSDSWRVVRGGSWDSFQGRVRSAVRYYLEPSSSDGDVGFRCARSGSEP
jgi:formylglycine-generating enzyme required for sulfatase activity